MPVFVCSGASFDGQLCASFSDVPRGMPMRGLQEHMPDTRHITSQYILHLQRTKKNQFLEKKDNFLNNRHLGSRGGAQTRRGMHTQSVAHSTDECNPRFEPRVGEVVRRGGRGRALDVLQRLAGHLRHLGGLAGRWPASPGTPHPSL